MSKRNRWLQRLLAPALLIAIAAIAWWGRDHLPTPQPIRSAADSAARNQVYYGPSNSIAVLPFTDASGEGQAALGEGFSRELIDLMQHIPALQVTAHSSSLFFRGRALPARVVSEQLRAAHILSGAYRETDGRVEVSISLVSARRDEEIEARTLAGPPSGVDAVHGDVLAAVLQAMDITVPDPLPTTRPASAPARRLVLQGLYDRVPGDAATLQAAREAFDAALQLEPGYGFAWVALAQTWLVSDTADAVAEARVALDQALSLDPQDADALALQSYLRRTHDWDWQGAEAAALRALEFKPGDAALMSSAALALSALGRFEQAVELLEGAVRRDPLNLSVGIQLGVAQEFVARYDDALSSYRRVAALYPEFPGVYASRARIKLIQDKPESALRESEKEGDRFWQRYARALALTALQRTAEAELALDALIDEDGH
ncbi:MAG: hypothetical protein RQ826_04440, partial [Xanthomonadales bacterium]|nr:hypothetical protein [Xanthomonadales bacterium]